MLIYKAALKKGVSVILFLFGSFCGYGQGIHVPVSADTLRFAAISHFPSLRQQIPGFVGHTFAIPVDLYAQHLPFFCRQELKMKDAHVPVSFRLGTVEQCDYLEKKKSEP